MKSLFFIVLCVGAIASFLSDSFAGGVHETVLRPGEQITAVNRFGKVRITYISPQERLFAWDNFSKKIKLSPRPERWYGCLGIYLAPSLLELVFPVVESSEKDQVPPLAIEEGIKNFRNSHQVAAELYQGSDVQDWVCDNSGLVVGFGKIPTRDNQVLISLFQFLIDGKKPTKVPGARPSQIHRRVIDPPAFRAFSLSKDKKPQDEIPPLIDDQFEPYGTEKESK